jgi:hypothetical protein
MVLMCGCSASQGPLLLLPRWGGTTNALFSAEQLLWLNHGKRP